MRHTVALIGFALAFLLGAFSWFAALACSPAEVRACSDFVDVLRACTDRNASPSGGGEDEDYGPCEAVDPECTAFFECATQQACNDELGYFTISIDSCEAPEGIRCL
ncbi:MAG TPA: hypothetical protein ENK31_02865 [Nannocystis exedens]|nr:hypothetical protein [Nannocystis exedens]